MAFITVVVPRPQLYSRFMLHGLGRVESDAHFREQLRLMAAILFAHWSDGNPDLQGVKGDVFDVVIDQPFTERGFTKTVKSEKKADALVTTFAGVIEPETRSDARLWFCSYIGFERITSKWAKENCPGCRGYICMRIYNQDLRHNIVDTHTVQIYF
jgi:hypothetical protein